LTDLIIFASVDGKTHQLIGLENEGKFLTREYKGKEKYEKQIKAEIKEKKEESNNNKHFVKMWNTMEVKCWLISDCKSNNSNGKLD